MNWRKIFSFLGAVYLLAGIFMFWGFMVGHHKVFPYAVLHKPYVEIMGLFSGEAPVTLPGAVKEVALNKPVAQIISNYFPSEAGLKTFSNNVDENYLLFSGLSPSRDKHSIKLIRLSDVKTLHEWSLNNNLYFNGKPKTLPYNLPDETRTRMFHPYLNQDGSIIFNIQDGPIIKIDSCSRHVWTNYGHFHHSINPANDGGVWAPSMIDDDKSTEAFIYKNLITAPRLYSITHLNQGGKVIETRSLLAILERNGYQGLLYGVQDHNDDILHLNSIVEAPSTTQYWQAGDLLLSVRNLSALMLYRPSTDKVVWLKVGPWISQHDARFIDGEKISVFGNQIQRGPKSSKIISSSGTNEVFIYNLRTNEVTTPYHDVLIAADVRTESEGRLRVFEDGTAYIEETNRGRQLLINRKSLLWQYVNRYNKDYLGMVSWSRYLTKDEVESILPNLECDQSNLRVNP
ncbi:MAG: hypothetical protein COY36_03490 [Zetaproteobacteria bacterium CG_4_10_14_0_2_um_filter_55_20]|nr:MAG: hypothetical protein COZ01_02530 [Zetaproteobacteria bacterium CG_4_10_14_0_8_um_filter_55_43]PIZ39262.1 MAG: hypothetical protein COY36_03490 [Zetaproteobacteria bacterium CG_4_10_14_0_2_um_filter_55_20]